jgi:hypothetical protein
MTTSTLKADAQLLQNAKSVISRDINLFSSTLNSRRDKKNCFEKSRGGAVDLKFTRQLFTRKKIIARMINRCICFIAFDENELMLSVIKDITISQNIQDNILKIQLLAVIQNLKL